ncbi:hypothetical protein EZS27_025350 [termite gut metagenome]|uniref:eCIS core domain-containing protein n=1 Tax=termite gut metagenome TaxID=433724 RepID=A0A5J4QW62_9ZZZZ
MRYKEIKLDGNLPEKCYENKKIMDLIWIIENAILCYEIDNDLLKLTDDKLLKKNENLTDYQYEEHSVARNFMEDRRFPLDTVTIQTFNMEYDTKIEIAVVHSGQYANEITRSLNALALTIGNEIYFKDGEYKPESEKGKQLLAHEFTHISQYKENRITLNTRKEDLEEEAEVAEMKQSADYDPIITVELGGQDFKIRKSEMSELVDMAVKRTIRWFQRMKMILSEAEYDKLLCAYSDWKKAVK